MKRPSWDEYFMSLASLAATRSTCLRRQVGAILVKDKRVLATGYNGAPSGLEHCDVRGCMRDRRGIPSGEKQELCRAIHAEQNVIVQAARYGVSIDQSVLYCTLHPCIICAKMLIASGVKEICYKEGYPDPFAIEMFEESGIDVRRIEQE